jgi:hypothetical protein
LEECRAEKLGINGNNAIEHVAPGVYRSCGCLAYYKQLVAFYKRAAERGQAVIFAIS